MSLKSIFTLLLAKLGRRVARAPVPRPRHMFAEDIEIERETLVAEQLSRFYAALRIGHSSLDTLDNSLSSALEQINANADLHRRQRRAYRAATL